jgi:hypothetical protein
VLRALALVLSGAYALTPVPLRAQCEGLTKWTESAAKGSARAYRIQRTLAAAYDSTGSPGVEIDGDIGSGTRAMMRRFCQDTGVSDVSALLADIDSFAVTLATYPGWRDTIRSDGFARWARAQPVGGYPGRIENRKPRAPGAALLIDAYRHQDMAGQFYLTPKEIEGLATAGPPTSYAIVGSSADRLEAAGAPAALVTRVTALQKLTYSTWDSLDLVVDVVLALDSTPVVVPRGPQEMDAALVIDEALRAPRAQRTGTASPYRALLTDSVERPADQGPAIDEAARNGLVQLANTRFPNGYLFRTAVRMTSGIGAARPAELDRIVALARKGTLPSAAEMADTLDLQPMAWAGGSCGCGVFEGAVDQEKRYFYGVYPFWAAPQRASEPVPSVPIEFSQLSRVAYYGLTFDARGELTDSLHWKQGTSGDSWIPSWVPIVGARDFSDFAKRGHQYKSPVDLVVYNADWAPWLPGDATDEAMSAATRSMADAFGTLREGIVDRISPRLTDLMDKIKPVVALGQSPTRTLGDGVTLDLDFEGLSSEDQSLLFDHLSEAHFFDSLRAELEERDGSDEGLLFDLDLDYHLNLIVPVHCVAAFGTAHECGFYSMAHLSAIAGPFDLILVDMTAQTADKELDLSALPLNERGRRLRAGLERMDQQTGVSNAQALTGKLVPLITPGSDAEVGAFLRAVKLFFAGVGTWSVPTTKAYGDSLNAVFFPPAPAPDLPDLAKWTVGALLTPMRGFERWVCDLACPHRWPVRVGIFLGTVFAVGLWVWSEWDFERKRYFETRRFLAFGIVMALALITTLWCDPFWSRQHGWILLAFVFAAGVLLVKSRTRLKRERHYP